jgi:hypothetical protein
VRNSLCGAYGSPRAAPDRPGLPQVRLRRQLLFGRSIRVPPHIFFVYVSKFVNEAEKGAKLCGFIGKFDKIGGVNGPDLGLLDFGSIIRRRPEALAQQVGFLGVRSERTHLAVAGLLRVGQNPPSRESTEGNTHFLGIGEETGNEADIESKSVILLAFLRERVEMMRFGPSFARSLRRAGRTD